jgi:hypothetical protein
MRTFSGSKDLLWILLLLAGILLYDLKRLKKKKKVLEQVMVDSYCGVLM